MARVFRLVGDGELLIEMRMSIFLAIAIYNDYLDDDDNADATIELYMLS